MKTHTHKIIGWNDKPPTPVSKPVTPTSSGSTTPSSSGIKPHPKHAL
ncbi:hypothetical protein AVEN_210396-1, partial [Araneus ventricosus]